MDKTEWAIVTGASSGIGKAFAEQLAQQGYHLFMVALESDSLAELSKKWSEQYQISIHYRALDLSTGGAVATLIRDVEQKGMDVSVLVNAAGFGYFGDFLAMNPDQIDRMVKVNVLALIELCYYILPKLRSRHRGTIINIASIAGHLPYPYAAVYAASKSMVHSFTKALWAENQDKGVSIISLSPGHTKTNFDHVSKEPNGIHLFPDEDPKVIARTTLERISPHRCSIFTRRTHRLKIQSARLLPIKTFAWMLRGLANSKRR